MLHLLLLLFHCFVDDFLGRVGGECRLEFHNCEPGPYLVMQNYENVKVAKDIQDSKDLCKIYISCKILKNVKFTRNVSQLFELNLLGGLGGSWFQSHSLH